MLDFLRRDGDSSNTVIGIILLVMLLVFVGPNVLPSLLSRTFPFLDEGVPCSILRTANNRAQHQSLIGRSATDPLILRTNVGEVPQPGSTDEWIIRITIQNNTIGTVPFVFNEDQVLTTDNQTSGVGILFNPPLALSNNAARTGTPASIPEDNIRLLGPRQRCVHRISFPATLANTNTIPANLTVTSYYRITTPGEIVSANVTGQVFTDQGLNILNGNNGIGSVQSEPEPLPSQS